LERSRSSTSRCREVRRSGNRRLRFDRAPARFGANHAIDGHIFSSYGNSFAPILGGRIRDEAGGAVVDVTSRPYAFVLAFSALWLSILMFGTLANVARGDVQAVPFLLAMALFVYALRMGGFLLGLSRSTKVLRSM